MGSIHTWNERCAFSLTSSVKAVSWLITSCCVRTMGLFFFSTVNDGVNVNHFSWRISTLKEMRQRGEAQRKTQGGHDMNKTDTDWTVVVWGLWGPIWGYSLWQVQEQQLLFDLLSSALAFVVQQAALQQGAGGTGALELNSFTDEFTYSWEQACSQNRV